MFSFRCNLFCLVSILYISLCIGSSYHTKKCVESDKQALLKLKDGFIDKTNILSSWSSEDCCKWKGISCDNLTGHVTSLSLGGSYYSRAVEGNIDSSICELRHLNFLDLSHNNLEGNIPKCIGSLGQLIELKLENNEFDSVIPHSMGNLSNLQTLNLENNFLVANDLEWLSHLPNLKYLNLSHLDLSGAIDWMSSISKLPSLIELRLRGSGLSQDNPKSIPHLNSSTLSQVLSGSKVLKHLDLSDNSLHCIPNGFANMISLQYLDLSYNELNGNISKFFQSLCQLKELHLTSNKLSSKLSDNIQQLCGAQNNLEVLDLSNNPFNSGPLPDFSWLSSLTTLTLRNTNIVGSFPQLSGHLPYLAVLDLSFNHLSGSLSLFEVSKLISLEDLNLSYNQLNGTLPYTIRHVSNLWRLCLSSNKINGVINEAHLSSLSRLKVLEVSENSLSIKLSSSWVPPFQLRRLYASSCILGPKFPTWIKHQRKLILLEISNSGISDSFPKWFWDLSSSLQYLNVSYNKLDGGLPKSIPGMKTIYPGAWDFSFNNLSGPLPSFPELYALFLSNNMFSGSVSSFCATSPRYLTLLDLSSNMLVGPLSDCWEKFQSLKILNLAKNNISGRIPKSFGKLQLLESLHLNNNNFSGEIPSLIRCSSLKFIDFGDNNLQGTIPAWIGHHMYFLIILRLRANKFQGSIPASLCNLLFLQVLDLSKNNITGEIPQCLDHISALSNMSFPRETISYGPFLLFAVGYGPVLFQFGPDEVSLFTDITVLAWKGENREYGKILGLLTSIDLSCNHLTGEIPQSITKLMALASFNLSGNHLKGFIPNNIGHMEILEVLDLSGNHLCGRMPPSFSNLTFLSYLNLSFNNLSGKIPLSTQLQSFDASTYKGNSGLCGLPLTKHCQSEVLSPTTTPYKHVNDQEEDKDKFITFGFYISLGLGFLVGFWGVCGTLVIKTSWRHAYFQCFDNINDWVYVTIVVFTTRMKRRFQVQD